MAFRVFPSDRMSVFPGVNVNNCQNIENGNITVLAHGNKLEFYNLFFTNGNRLKNSDLQRGTNGQRTYFFDTRPASHRWHRHKAGRNAAAFRRPRAAMTVRKALMQPRGQRQYVQLGVDSTARWACTKVDSSDASVRV